MTGKAVALLLMAGFLSVQPGRAQDSVPETGINTPEICMHFSKLLGESLDSLPNPELYLFIYDWLGTPYKYAGDCRDGIDCSGFADELYFKIYGMRLAGSSAQLYKMATPVKKSSLEEGDLVFFKIRKHRISHVGIYLRNNKFVHASVKNGVMISDLNEPYYKNHFYKGGRVAKINPEESH